MAQAIGMGATRQNVEYWLEVGRVPLQFCAALEIATNATVTRRELRPTDWHRIWPELITEDFPAPELASAGHRRATQEPSHAQ